MPIFTTAKIARAQEIGRFQPAFAPLLFSVPEYFPGKSSGCSFVLPIPSVVDNFVGVVDCVVDVVVEAEGAGN